MNSIDLDKIKDSLNPSKTILLGSNSNTQVKPFNEPSKTDSESKVKLFNTKDTNVKYTNNKYTNIATHGVAGKELNNLIELFKDVNPSYKRLFSNKTQRLALERLLVEYGEAKLSGLIGVLVKTNKMEYAPNITTPYELEMKLGKLKSFIDKQRNKQSMVLKV
jgi:hypothetical protein